LVLRGGAAGAVAAAVALLAGRAKRAGGLRGAGLREVAQTQEAAAVQPTAVQGARSYDFGQRWLFGGRYVAGAELPGYRDAGFARITLPHTVTRLSWDDWDYAAWQHQWIYRKHFDGGAVSGGRALLTFDGVMTNASLWLNGTALGSHRGGYLPWTTELTGHLRGGDNVLAVVADGRWLDVPPDALAGGPPTMDYLQPAGIYRDATLEVVPEIYLADVFARPENVLSAGRVVRVQATVDAAVLPAGGDALVSVRLLDGSRTLASARATAKITATGRHVVTLTVRGIGGVTYWSPEQPKLYTVETTLSYQRTGKPGGTHTISTTIGFRTAVFTTEGFYLNGRRYEIFGLNRHQMFPYLGMAAPRRLQRKDAQILKDELNCNMVRCSHYPQSPHFLDACDELGIMVWQEPPGWVHMGDAAFQARVLDDVRDMVIRDRNRPSVVVWGTRLDETKDYPALYARARAMARALDGSRQTAGAVTFHTTANWAEDVFSYDDYHIIDGEPQLYPPVAGVPYLVSEAVGAAVNFTYRWFDPPATLANQAFAHALVREQAQADPRYAGVLAWAGFDYYAAPSSTSAVARAKNWHTMRTPGVVDVFRVPKPGAAIYQSQVPPAARAVIVPVFFWDNGSAPGAGSMFATNCDRLEIYIGGAHLATARPDRNRFGHLAYPPAFADLTTAGGGRLADLRVDGYAGTKRVATLLMTADTSRDRLHLAADDAVITADGSDTTRITFGATDAYGNHRPNVTGDVTLSLTGPGILIGSNPFPFGAYGGVGGAFLRSIPGKPGSVTVAARHPILGSARVAVTVAGGPGNALSSVP
jgi:beta-galactosidase